MVAVIFFRERISGERFLVFHATFSDVLLEEDLKMKNGRVHLHDHF
jgi:hypothetical protein